MAFRATPALAPIEAGLYSLSDTSLGMPNMFHVPFSMPSLALSHRAVEVFSVFLPLPLSDADKSSFEARMDAFFPKLVAIAKKYGSVSEVVPRGWIREEQSVRAWGEGKNATGVVILIGWESVEHHMKARDSEGFKEAVGELLVGIKEGGKEMHHVLMVR
jgi:hypothetical protein